nr:hypothetical protein [Gammaproteobacteria bacterium]
MAASAYPDFRPLPGSLVEYNGKSTCGQRVLRGGCCATPAGHGAPATAFFYPHQRWPFTGLRLVREDWGCRRPLAFFPDSSIGNLTPLEVMALLANLHHWPCAPASGC